MFDYKLSARVLSAHNLSRGYKTFFIVNSAKQETSTAQKHLKKYLTLSLSDVVFIMLIKLKKQQLLAFLHLWAG